MKLQAQALKSLLVDAPGAYAPLVKNAGAQTLLRHNGHLIVYRSQREFDGDSFGWQLRRENGIAFDILDEDELRQLEPNLSRVCRVAAFFPYNSYTVSLKRLVKALGAEVRSGRRHVVEG